jgi:formylglycine-generating enzyme required for sulfatase activity
MVLVPAGDFESGKYRQHATVPAFYIDKTEVTNAAYQEFCNATGRPLPEKFPADRPELPVVNVSIIDAHAFANWAGKRLPSGSEWEKAARGSDGRSFPWGNEREPSALPQISPEAPALTAPFRWPAMPGSWWSNSPSRAIRRSKIFASL